MSLCPDLAEAYALWAKRSDVNSHVMGMRFQIVGHNLAKLLDTPIPRDPHLPREEDTIYAGKRRFISEAVARMLGIEPNPYPDNEFSWLEGALFKNLLKLRTIRVLLNLVPVNNRTN